MKNWIPIPGTTKDKIIQVAIRQFSQNGYEETNIVELAKEAEVTTGAIYHHFGSKMNLYELVRTEMEQRIIDRMEGAASLFDDKEEALTAALITSLHFVVQKGLCLLLSEEKPYERNHHFEEIIKDYANEDHLYIVILASWKAILKGIHKKVITHEEGKNLLNRLFR